MNNANPKVLDFYFVTARKTHQLIDIVYSKTKRVKLLQAKGICKQCKVIGVKFIDAKKEEL